MSFLHGYVSPWFANGEKVSLVAIEWEPIKLHYGMSEPQVIRQSWVLVMYYMLLIVKLSMDMC